MMIEMTRQILFGFDHSHLCVVPGSSALLHKDVIAPLSALCAKASEVGFDLVVASGFRSVEKQADIWNGKVRGERPVLNSDGQPIDIRKLTDWELLQAILRWSALPGASRHHWGTDFDIYDKSCLPAGYRLQLTVEECEPGGVFAAFYEWFSPLIDSDQANGFFRPYAIDYGGVSREPWHLSYRPLADEFCAALSIDALAEIVEQSEILHKDLVLKKLPEIYQCYVLNRPS
ncbi:M15 family metallopeptidase [Aurantivibrio plasticivorans]